MREGRNGGKLKEGGSNGGGRPKKLPALDLDNGKCHGARERRYHGG
jgi:hypothetical protein